MVMDRLKHFSTVVRVNVEYDFNVAGLIVFLKKYEI